MEDNQPDQDDPYADTPLETCEPRYPQHEGTTLVAIQDRFINHAWITCPNEDALDLAENR